ncbi:MAG: cobalamin B12-binding domain-containing protein, partial [Herminiimonas sp.]|nr:cobalamin B12-binding domain-containing protein [Herminiimonas sp.]
EVLRKWESRYGFPVPLRDALGNRLYSGEDLSRLRLIKRLMDGGLRPAQVVALDHAQLLALVESAKPAPAPCQSHASSQLLSWLHLRDPSALRRNLQEELTRVGLETFIVEIIPSMNAEVGEAWERQEIFIRDEHMYTEIMQELLRGAVAQIAKPHASPRVLITTPTGELHTLGVLMLQGFLTSRGASCISLGAQTPAAEIGHASAEYQADIVGLSFSASFPKRRAEAILREVRALVPSGKELWAGGQGVTGLERDIRGVRIMRSFEQIEKGLERYRARGPARVGSVQNGLD